MRIGKLALAVLTVGALALAASGAHAAWYDGGVEGMADKAVVWVAEFWVCGWGGC